MSVVNKESIILSIEALKTLDKYKLEIVISHDNEPALRIMADSNLYNVFTSVATLCYDLGKRDMRTEDKKPKVN